MKKIVFSLLSVTVMAAGIAYAQTAKKATPAPTAATAQKTETEVIDLSNVEIPAKMSVPKGVKGEVGKYDNSIKGPNNFEISIENAEMTIAEQRAKTEKDDMTKFVKYLAQDANGFMYMAKIMGRDVCHFEYILNVGGKSFRLYDKRVSPLTEEQVKPMYEAAKSTK